jgi:hypothetical protein
MKKIKKFHWNKVPFDHIIKDITHYYCTILTREQIKEILKKYPEMYVKIVRDGFDTIEREQFISYLLEHIGVTKTWPLNSDSHEYVHEFYKNYIDIATKSGYKIK